MRPSPRAGALKRARDERAAGLFQLEGPAVERGRPFAAREEHHRHPGRLALEAADLLEQLPTVARLEQDLQQHEARRGVAGVSERLMDVGGLEQTEAEATQLAIGALGQLRGIVDVEDGSAHVDAYRRHQTQG